LRLFVADELIEAGVVPETLMEVQGFDSPGACTSRPIALYRFAFMRLMTVV
jgi:hypothetical protein